MESGAQAGDMSESDGPRHLSVVCSRTSFTMSAGDLNTKGCSGDRDSLFKEFLLLGGL